MWSFYMTANAIWNQIYTRGISNRCANVAFTTFAQIYSWFYTILITFALSKFGANPFFVQLDVRGLQPLIGAVTYLSKLLPQLSTVREPLRRLTDSNSRLPEHEDAFARIKELTTQAPVFAHPVRTTCSSSTKTDRKELCSNRKGMSSNCLCEWTVWVLHSGQRHCSSNFWSQTFDDSLLKANTHKPKSMRLWLQTYPLKVFYKPGPQMLVTHSPELHLLYVLPKLTHLHTWSDNHTPSFASARDIMYWREWPLTSEAVQRCDICRQIRAALPKGPSMTFPIPNLSWQIVASDCFECDGSHYLIVVDLYSDYIEIKQLYVTLISDNGLNYASAGFSYFAYD